MNTDIITITPPDTLTKVQAELAAVAEKISNSSTEELLSELVDKAVSFGLKVMAAVAIYIIGAWLIRKLKKVIGKIFEKKNTDAAIASFIQSIISIALTVVLVIITVGALGIDTTSIAALLAGGGMAIGLALNGTVQNFAGGIMILVFRPFKSGDYIQTQGFEGIVTEVNIVSTKLTTVDNKCVVIPNGSLSNGTINNFSQNDLRRLSWNVDVEYGSSSDLTKEVMLELMKNDKRILTTADGAPADPFVALSELSSSSVKFVMRAWVRAEDYWDVNFDMNESIYKELPKKGIMFPYQKLDVTILK
jgi:small conductance mechanosensitive channel